MMGSASMSSRDSRSASSRLNEAVPSGHADAIFINGKFVTADAAFRVVSAVAVREGRFLAVGTTDEIRSIAGPSTTVVDLQGQTVVGTENLIRVDDVMESPKVAE